MDYSPLITDKILGEKKSQFSNVLKSLKMMFFMPAAGGKFWGPKLIMDYSPPYYRQISNKGGIVHKDSIDPYSFQTAGIVFDQRRKEHCLNHQGRIKLDRKQKPSSFPSDKTWSPIDGYQRISQVGMFCPPGVIY